MQDDEPMFLTKARESLAGAESEFANERYSNCANRCYYAAFQAAVSALDEHGFVPLGGRGRTTWSHEALPATFVGELVNRRKVYPPELRDTLSRLASLREAADYTHDLISETQASRALRRTRTFVGAIVQRREDQQQ
jgi:uncharacterized protein (UPF0332 family)